MRRDTWKCRYCGRRSERVSLGLSCFHCGRRPDVIQIETQLFRYDLGHYGIRSLPHISGTREHIYLAEVIHFDHGTAPVRFVHPGAATNVDEVGHLIGGRGGNAA